MKVLVTGGAGYIGSHVVVELIAAGHTPVVVDNLSNSMSFVYDNISRVTGKNFVHYDFDIRETDKLKKVVVDHKCDAVIHLAAYKSVGESVKNPLVYYDNNINGLISLLKSLEGSPCHSIIFSSSTTVYGTPDTLPMTEESPIKPAANPYGYTKQVCEEILSNYAKTSKKKGVLLRYFNPVGAHESGIIGEIPMGVPSFLLPYILETADGTRSKLTIFGGDYETTDGTAVRDYIHISDLARAHINALQYATSSMQQPVDAFNIGSGKGTSVLEFVKTFEKVTGVNIPYSIGERRSGDIAASYASHKKATDVLRWEPKHSLEDALTSAWKWYGYYKTMKKTKAGHQGVEA